MTASAFSADRTAATAAAWCWLLADRGHEPTDASLGAPLTALTEGMTGEGAEALAGALAEAVATRLGGQGLDELHATLASAYSGKVQPMSVADREDGAHEARRYHFRTGLPWLARIVERAPSGELGIAWVIVEDLTDTVHVLDPSPWDDVDDTYTLPLADFLVRWELAGCEALRLEA